MAQQSSGSDSLPVAPEALRRKFAQVRQWQLIGRVVVALAAIAVVGEFLLFVSTTKSDVQANFASTERNTKAAKEAIPVLSPIVVDEARKIAGEVGPVYRQMAYDRYEKVRDTLSSKVATRFQQLPDEGGKILGQRLTASFDKVIKRIEPDLKAAFPSLTDEQRRDLLIAGFEQAVTEQNNTLATKFQTIHSEETERLRGTLARFSLPTERFGKTDEQLRQELVRSLSLLAAQELQSFANPPTAAVADTK